MRFQEGMICPVCEEGKLKASRKSVDFEYKGQKVTIEHARSFECPICGEAFWDEKDERQIERMLTDERRRVDGLLTSGEIKELRESFRMTQVEFARALGVGEKNFARYETGQSIQGRTTDHLLRILKRYPHTFNEIVGEEVTGWKSQQIEIIVNRRPRESDAKVVIFGECDMVEEGKVNACTV